jgi:hypothetical protein
MKGLPKLSQGPLSRITGNLVLGGSFSMNYKRKVPSSGLLFSPKKNE